MPLYDFRCRECGAQEERYAGMDEREAECSTCQGQMKRLITSKIHLQTDYASASFVTADITGDPVRITSRKQLRSLCEAHDVRPKETAIKNETLERRLINKYGSNYH